MAEIRTIAVIGAGAVGRGIAFAAALGGYRTILEDILPSSLRMASAELREHLARAADLVIEAVPDELESKIEIFTLLDKICRPQTILVSNTSALSVTEIASITYRAAKIAGMR